MTRLSFILAAIAMALPASATERSGVARRDFARSVPCPSTGQNKLPCPGYVIDHLEPLCAGGEDHPRNMQYQEIGEAKEKDRWERSTCSKKNRPKAAWSGALRMVSNRSRTTACRSGRERSGRASKGGRKPAHKRRRSSGQKRQRIVSFFHSGWLKTR